MFCYLFSSCPAPLHNILFISLGMGERLPFYACALVLSQFAGPLLVALTLPWGHTYQVASIWKLQGGNLVPITTSVPLNASHPEHIHAELQISEGRIPNKIASLGSELVWVLTCSLIKISWSKSCCLCRGDDFFFTTFCSLPFFLVTSCLKKNKKDLLWFHISMVLRLMMRRKR